VSCEVEPGNQFSFAFAPEQDVRTFLITNVSRLFDLFAGNDATGSIGQRMCNSCGRPQNVDRHGDPTLQFSRFEE